MTRRSDSAKAGPLEQGVDACFHTSGDLLMVHVLDDVTRFWDAATGRELIHTTDLGPLGPIRPLVRDRIPASFGARRSGSGSCRGSGNAGDLSSDRTTRYPLGIEFSPDGRVYRREYEFGLVRFWDVGDALPRWRVFNSSLRKIQFNPGATSITRWTGRTTALADSFDCGLPAALALRFPGPARTTG